MKKNNVYLEKIKQPKYNSLYRPGKKTETNIGDIRQMNSRMDFVKGVDNMLNNLTVDNQNGITKQQIRYIANKYYSQNNILDTFLESNRRNMTQEELNYVLEGLKKEKNRIMISEFAQYQKKWATFGSPK